VSRPPNRAEAERINRGRRKVLQQINTLLGLNWRATSTIVLIAVVLGVLGNAVFGIMHALLDLLLATPKDQRTPMVPMLVMTAISLAGVAYIVLLGRKSFALELNETSPIIEIDDPLSVKPKVAIFFVSRPPGELSIPNDKNIPKAVSASIAEISQWGEEPEASDRANKNLGPWRMPLTALHHLLSQPGGDLQQIILVPSADTASTGDPSPGTHQVVEKLRSLILETCHRHEQPNVKCHLLGEVLGENSILAPNASSQGLEIDLRQGLPFASFETTLHMLKQLYASLTMGSRSGMVLDAEIVLDITSGMATNSAAAAIFAMQKKERKTFYIDTNTYDVKLYDTLEDIMDPELEDDLL